MRIVRTFLISGLILFIVPAMATAAWWTALDRPDSWRNADWSSSGLLPAANEQTGPAVYVLAARTGGMKGAFSLHSWLVLKREGAFAYERFDKVGWGSPVRRNGWAPDGLWYSNRPEIVAAITGPRAGAVLADIEAAIEAYPFSGRGGYRIWPGPNSNSFVAHVLRQVPELDVVLPPNAAGRDYRPGLASMHLDSDWRNLHVTFGGWLGFAVGVRSGIELHFLGLVAGYDFRRPAFKVPAFGRVAIG